MTSRVWLNGKFRMKPWTQTVSLNLSQHFLTLNQRERGYLASGIDSLRDVVDGYQSLRCYISSFNGLDNQMSLLWGMK